MIAPPSPRSFPGDAARIEAARRRLRQAGDEPSRRALAGALAEAGYLDAALLTLHQTGAGGGEDGDMHGLRERLLGQRERRDEALRRRRSALGLPVREVLGIGWEGAVYRVDRPAAGAPRPSVLKAFHPHVVREIAGRTAAGEEDPLRRLAVLLAQAAGRPEHLTPFELIERDGRVVGLCLSDERLSPVSGHHLRFRRARLALLGAFLRCQRYLILHGSLCLTDGSRSNFMRARGGRLRMTDYGTSILSLGDRRCREDCWHGAGLTSLVCSLWWREGRQRTVGASAAELAATVQRLLPHLPHDRALDPLRGLLRAIPTPASLDPAAYERAAQRLPRRIPPWIVAAAAWAAALRRRRRR